MPSLTVAKLPARKQYRKLISIHGTLSGLLIQMGQIPCRALQHDEQQLMVQVYIGLEQQRDAIAAVLNPS